jgi:hypothetical protein
MVFAAAHQPSGGSSCCDNSSDLGMISQWIY